jgi:hypothetical protein
VSIRELGEHQQRKLRYRVIKDTTLKALPHAQHAEASIRFLVGQVLETVFLTFPRYEKNL